MFKGFEIDVVFDKNESIFDVNHPPTDSIHLSLAELLGSLAKPSAISYWLDVKNLDKNNAAASLNRLLQLCELFNIKTNSVIVESQSYHLLSIFTTKGFKTSYYLPTPFIASLAAKFYQNLTTDEEQLVLRIQNSINKGTFDYISTDSQYLPFIDTLLKNKKKILLWNTSLEHHKFFDRKKIKQIIESDKDIHVLLIQLESQYDR